MEGYGMRISPTAGALAGWLYAACVYPACKRMLAYQRIGGALFDVLAHAPGTLLVCQQAAVTYCTGRSTGASWLGYGGGGVVTVITSTEYWL
jgi:hypothetical protein